MKRKEPALFALLSLLSLSYLAGRIWFNPFVNDEAYSFLHFVFKERFIPFLNAPFTSANNHILNSFLSWIVYKITGANEVWLRLPNFLAYIGLLLLSYRLGKMISSSLLRWLFWIMFLGSAPIMEFFTYSRGYGLSFTLLVGSIYFLHRAFREGRLLREWRSWLLIVLAVFANLNMLHSYLTWLLLFALIAYRQVGLKRLFPILALKSVPLLYLIPLGVNLRQAGELYFGTDSGINKSINSLLSLIFSETARAWDWVVLGLLLVIAMGALGTDFRRNKANAMYQFAAALLILNVLGALLQHVFLDVLLPVHRSILHWYLLFVLAAFFGLDQLAQKARFSALLTGILLFSSMLFQLNNYNLFRSSEISWRNEQIPEGIYEEVKLLSKVKSRLLTIETDLPEIEYTWNFLNFKNAHQLNKIQVLPSGFESSAGDILITREGTALSLLTAFDKIYEDPYSDLILLQRKEYFHQKLLQTESTGRQKDELIWVQLLKKNDFEKDVPLLLEVQTNLKSQQVPVNLVVQLRFFDAASKPVEVKQIKLAPLKTDWGKAGLLHFSHILYLWPQPAVKMDVGIYNPEGHYLQVNSAECSIFKLSKKS